MNMKSFYHLLVKNKFLKVLVDAPCTTDRLSLSVDENNIFSVNMTTERLNLPILQTKLLMFVDASFIVQTSSRLCKFD